MATQPTLRALLLCTVLVGANGRPCTLAAAEDAGELRRQIEALQQSNTALVKQLQQQQALVESLARKVDDLQQQSSAQSKTLDELKPAAGGGASPKQMPASPLRGLNFGKLHLSGAGAVAFVDTGRQGNFPSAEFRVDEAKLFAEAPVWDHVYAFAEINLAQREYDELELRLGEFYLEFENISRLWNRDRMLSVRAGRMDVPFGEEYQVRDAIDNPLISHSLPDIWGVDEGLELYGKWGKVSYAFAVQNGGISGNRDFNSDKSIAGRIGYDPTRWLHMSVSGMRTGNLSAEGDQISELWFGGGWFRSIGSTNTTLFHASLLEGDVEVRWDRGHLKAFGGAAWYDDNDPGADNRRTIYFYSVEAMQKLTRKFYASARFGQILADKGYPLPGHGSMGTYFFSPLLTDDIWRLSFGLGYRLSDDLVIKAEYAFERAKLVGGGERNQEDLFAIQAALRF